METVNLKVEGMTCSNCALTISRYLDQQGLKNVKVNPLDGDVSYETGDEEKPVTAIAKGIEGLGYSVVDRKNGNPAPAVPKMNRFLRYTLFCLPFTLVLMLHMVGVHWIMNPWVQLALCVPVYIIGMQFFGKSAVKSLANGFPNMNVLVALGATAAFVYSLAGTLFHLGEGYLFYETCATIITLVFFGNYLEDASVNATQRALQTLVKSQVVMANMIAFDDQHQEIIFPIDNSQLKPGDLVLVNSGDQIPADGKILWGDGEVNEAIITGESLPVEKHAKDHIVGGSILVNGSIKVQVTSEAKDSVLANIINLVKKAQGDKPPMQLLADRISAIFVPVVLAIALITFLANLFILHDTANSMLRAIAVLVIACPCAMGIATPAAIAVGLGRAARSGVLFRNAKSLEAFRDIKQVVFDKTGTLTTGSFSITAFHFFSGTENDFKRIVYSLEKHSGHPLASAISKSWKSSDLLRWEKIEEIKGQGMKGIDKAGNLYQAGSYKIATSLTEAHNHNVYILKNGDLLGWIDVADETRSEAESVIRYLRKKNIRTILLSGDRTEKCLKLAQQLGIDEVFAEHSPEQKLEKITNLTLDRPTAMVGDGINDAPALARATIGISLSDASQVAMQTADVVLMNHGIKNLPVALGLGKHTFITIRQNLFWAFAYNIVAIPVAAFGLLVPALAALAMGFSDVILALNSVRLFIKKWINQMQSIHAILKNYWGYDSFRPIQEDIIRSVLAGKDTLALLPTGGGKSICYQVPALVNEGLCLVVSPLIALMKDQVANLRRKGITAFAIYSGMSRKDVINTLKLATSGNARLLYVSPERLETKLFLEYLPALSVSLLAVDEAHCISQWGYDFRPPYLRIADLRDQLPGVPVLALTASATPEVQEDICRKLQFKDENIFRQSFERSNLSYSVFKVDSKINKLVEILTNVKGSSIVYCRSRKRTKEIAAGLQSYQVNADFYHAGLSGETRSEKQEQWIQDKIRSIVCTNAFGMGIDKPDVRAVVHIDMPDCLENYYQEAGRAGRDGKKSYAVLLYQEKDITDLRNQAELRFPMLEDIRKVYQALVNYLQVPAGSGAYSYYDFDLRDFLSKFKLPAHLVINSLKVLEQENWLSFNEQVFLSSRVAFNCNKTMLYDFEQSQPFFEPLIKSLLRTYEGIFDQDTPIHEKTIAYLLKSKPAEVTKQLTQLDAFHIISYTPQIDSPQVYFMENRVKAEELVIDLTAYKKRKERYIQRLETFLRYLNSTDCRSMITGNYFGDAQMKPCGICDNCLRKNKKEISAVEFDQIRDRILAALIIPVFSRELPKLLSGVEKEKTWKVLEFLQAEKKIELTGEGMVRRID